MSRFRYLQCSGLKPDQKLLANITLCYCRGEKNGKQSQEVVTFRAGAFQRKVTERGKDVTLNIVMLG